VGRVGGAAILALPGAPGQYRVLPRHSGPGAGPGGASPLTDGARASSGYHARMSGPDASERAYAFLAGDDGDERACEAIPEAACREVPRNYLLNLGNGASSKLAEQLAGHNLVLPWLLAGLGAPASVIAWLAPLRQAGTLAPQLLVSAQIRRLALRKWAWVGAGLVQAMLLAAIAAIAFGMEGARAGVLIVIAFGLFCVASGAGSVAFQDVLGKTIPKGRRGRLLSQRAAVGGALTIAAGLMLGFWLGEDADTRAYALLIVVAAALWGLAALAFALTDETPGATEGGRNPARELGAGLRLLAGERGYRRFLEVRALLLSVELAAPFYALHARELFGGSAGALGAYVVTVGVANVIASPLWGRFADQDSARVMAIAGTLAALAAALAVGIALLPETARAMPMYLAVFALLGIAEAGVRLGRKTWLVDHAPAGARPLWVAFSNTSVGLLAIALGSLGLLADAFGLAGVIALLGVAALAGAVRAGGLR
jgi:predicted MFS family arabinose efflux permease